MNTETQTWRFDVPAAIIHGGGSRRRLPEIIRQLGGSRVLLVTDPGIVQLGMAAEVIEILTAAGADVAVFDQVQADPTDENVAAGVDALKAHRADLVVALGGGSPIDAAKVIAIRPANPEPLPGFMGLHKIPNQGVPLVAIPTTAGTGSEVTKVAVITDTKLQTKMMMLSAPLLPRAAIVDYELTLSMPPATTAAVGVDTLTHGIEAYVSRKANILTDPIALKCIELTARHLQTAWSQPDNRSAREGMMLAATLGGMAFSNSSVCLVHGMSRPIGALFHVPHGLSNAVLLPTVTRYSVEAAPARYATIARTISDASNDGSMRDSSPSRFGRGGEERAGVGQGSSHDASDDDACAALIAWLEELNQSLELPRLSQCRGVTRKVFDASVEKMASDAVASGSPANNPRVPDASEIVRLYNHAW